MAHSDQSGFTLLELMITVAILAILAALALPSFQSVLEGRRLVGAAENLFADLQFARSESIKRNEVIRFQVTTGANWCFGVDDDDGAACDCTSGACEVDTVPKNVVAADYTDIQMSVGGVVEFDPRQGMPDTAQTYTFRIGASGNTKNVTVNAIGRVKMD
jgi:type IV fimbrial biogenesis protein FimT